MKLADILAADAEYQLFAPVLEVVKASTDKSGWDADAWENYGEHIAEIGSERAGCSDTPLNDAKRIYDDGCRHRALRRFGEQFPRYSEMCDAIRYGLML